MGGSLQYLTLLPMHETYDETEQKGRCLYSGAGCAFAYNCFHFYFVPPDGVILYGIAVVWCGVGGGAIRNPKNAVPRLSSTLILSLMSLMLLIGELLRDLLTPV